MERVRVELAVHLECGSFPERLLHLRVADAKAELAGMLRGRKRRDGAVEQLILHLHALRLAELATAGLQQLGQPLLPAFVDLGGRDLLATHLGRVVALREGKVHGGVRAPGHEHEDECAEDEIADPAGLPARAGHAFELVA